MEIEKRSLEPIVATSILVDRAVVTALAQNWGKFLKKLQVIGEPRTENCLS